jgi:hypothetical protein
MMAPLIERNASPIYVAYYLSITFILPGQRLRLALRDATE